MDDGEWGAQFVGGEVQKLRFGGVHFEEAGEVATGERLGAGDQADEQMVDRIIASLKRADEPLPEAAADQGGRFKASPRPGHLSIGSSVRKWVRGCAEFDDRSPHGFGRRYSQDRGHRIVEGQDPKVAGVDYRDSYRDRVDHFGDGREEALGEGRLEQLRDRF